MPNFLRYKRFSLFVVYIFASASLSWYQKASAAFVQPLRSKRAMVVSAHPLGSEAGLAMLRKGGNAVDAAVATTFAISVVEPFSAGIGGGGFLLLRLGKTGELKALDFRERAPIRATRNMYLDSAGKVRPRASTDGYLSVAVPGTVAGLYEIHRQYGRLSWQETIAPAIKLAQDGFPVSHIFTDIVQARKGVILNNPAARQVFTRNGAMYVPGDLLVQQDLAKTLQKIAQDPQSFYTGDIARAIASDMAKNGGLIALEDLKSYKPVDRRPVCGNFRKARICSMPPPSSGGVHLLEILNIIGDTNLKSKGWHSPDTLHLLTEAMKIAYADRATYLGDPDFVKVPLAALIDPAYANMRRKEISMDRARPSSDVKAAAPEILQRFVTSGGNREQNLLAECQQPGFVDRLLLHYLGFFAETGLPCARGNTHIRRLSAAKESEDTTHISVVDEDRNALSLTFTVNYRFGSGVVVPGTGILLNDEMDDFAAAPGVPNTFGLVGGDANAIAPRKTPLSSMTPTIVTENDRLRMVTGAPGGSTIITTVLQVVLNVLEYDMNAGQAVSAPRIHHQWLPDKLNVEPYGLDAATLAELRRRGHNIEERSPWGNANAIVVRPDSLLEGAADPRGEGAPSGY